MKWIVATPSRDLSAHDTKAAAFRKAAKFIRAGVGRRNLDVYSIKTRSTSFDPSVGLGYRIEQMHDIRVRDGLIVAQRYAGSGHNIGRPVVLGYDRR